MRPKAALIVPLTLAIALGACHRNTNYIKGGPDTSNRAGVDIVTQSDAPKPELDTAQAASGFQPATKAANDEATDTSIAATSPTAAADVIRAYYSDIDRGDYGAAYARWADGGKASGKSAAAFRKGFGDTSRTVVDVGDPGTPHGAAGSVYIDIPVRVHAQQDDGGKQRFAGTYTLRRAEPGTGASTADRRWHIASASLKPAT